MSLKIQNVEFSYLFYKLDQYELNNLILGFFMEVETGQKQVTGDRII